LHAVTDGEYRRAFWHYDFLAGLDGVEMVEVAHEVWGA
jgi:5-methyltetrahydropteroyltriglutamate--homocysteine methyltransferase